MDGCAQVVVVKNYFDNGAHIRALINIIMLTFVLTSSLADSKECITYGQIIQKNKKIKINTLACKGKRRAGAEFDAVECQTLKWGFEKMYRLCRTPTRAREK